MKPQLLYIGSGHFNQCYDDLLMFTDLGFGCYDVGYFYDTNKLNKNIIPNYRPKKKYQELLQQCVGIIAGNNEIVGKILADKNKIYSGGRNPRNIWNFTKEFISNFDILVFNHFISNIINNLDIIDNNTQLVIFKTFAMHNPADEVKIGSLRALDKIVRVSNNEYEKLRTPLYGGEDYIIHGSVLPNEEVINNWNGKKKQICTFTNGFNCFGSANLRRNYYIQIKQKCQDYDFFLYGSNNENEPLSSGFINTEKKIGIMKDSRVHLITGTPGSSCTYSLVESTVMGAPVVCYGKRMWQSECYEPSKLFSHGEEILIGETPEECADYINLLMDDIHLCKYLSKNIRKKSVSIYGRKTIAKQWKQLFDDFRVKFNDK